MRTKVILALFVLGIVFIASGFYLSLNKKERTVKSVLNSKIEPVGSKFQAENQATAFGRQVLIKNVLDGDTAETENGEHIRYIGINAPEKNDPLEKESFEFNKKLVFQKNVKLEFDIAQKDRYGRILAYVFVGNTFVNSEMIKNGLAAAQTIQPNVKYQDIFLSLQKQAREMCLGIWKSLCKKSENKVLGQSQNCIEIVSIHADAKGNDNQNKNDEWVEIKNTCTNAVSTNGWFLKDSSASNKYQFKDVSIDGGKNIYLHSGCGQDTFSDIYWSCPEGKYAIWNNSDDSAFLYDNQGELVSQYSY